MSVNFQRLRLVLNTEQIKDPNTFRESVLIL